jgi:hypothetical protein
LQREQLILGQVLFQLAVLKKMGADYEQFHNQLFIALPETPTLHYFFIMTLLCTHSLKGCPISNLLDDLMKASFIF